MPLNLPIDSISQVIVPGTLYVVATPIGNLNDMTLRAVAILAQADLVAAEDTRNAARLLAHFGIKVAMISCHEHNEAQRTPQLIQRLKGGGIIALISNAGTPTVSDPGYRLVQSAAAEGIRVVPIPGACAAVAALSASGLPTDSYTFIGFPAKKAGKQLRQLQELALEPRTLIFYESPRRLTALLKNLMAAMGDRQAVLTRELTKIHEEILRGRLSEIHDQLVAKKEVKGECTLLVHGAPKDTEVSEKQIEMEIEAAWADGEMSLAELSKKIAVKHGITKREVYETALKIKGKRH